MISINPEERQHLINMAYSPEIYGKALPTQINKQWVCPHCKFKHPEIDRMIIHLSSKCDSEK